MFGWLVGWVLWHINHCRLFNTKSSLYIYIKYIWFGLVWVLWHINHCRLFNTKSSLYIYIRYIWFGFVGFYGISTTVGYLIPNPLYTYILFGFVGFYGISTTVGYLIPNPLYTYILDIYDFLLGFMAYQPLRLFNTKSSLFIYINYIGFGLVGFYGISTTVGYLMPYPLYTYTLNIYGFVWFGFMTYQPL